MRLLVSGILLATLVGCGVRGTLYWSDFGKCLAADGISDSSGVGGQAAGILEGAGTTSSKLSALEGLGASLGGEAAIQTVECAVEAWLYPAPAASPSPSAAVKSAKPDTGVEAAKAFIAKHNAAIKRP